MADDDVAAAAAMDVQHVRSCLPTLSVEFKSFIDAITRRNPIAQVFYRQAYIYIFVYLLPYSAQCCLICDDVRAAYESRGNVGCVDWKLPLDVITKKPINTIEKPHILYGMQIIRQISQTLPSLLRLITCL